jgi:glycerol uptake facilitator-like aquaporin
MPGALAQLRQARLHFPSGHFPSGYFPSGCIVAPYDEPVTLKRDDSLRRLPKSYIEFSRKLTAELLGTAFLIIAVVGSGIMAQRLSPNDIGLQLFENAAATAGALIGLILLLGPVSGAHFNPAVTLSFRVFGQQTNAETVGFISAQIIGGCIGTLLANLMFGLDAVNVSTKVRSSGALWLSEGIATVGLLLLIHGILRSGRGHSVPFAVGAWIGGAYWFTSSTSFANPAVTIARTLSNTFAGIQPSSVPMFVVMQLVGTFLAVALIKFLYPIDLSKTLEADSR